MNYNKLSHYWNKHIFKAINGNLIVNILNNENDFEVLIVY